MRIKKAGGKIFGAVLSAAEKKAMDMEINRQIVEADRRYADDIDAMVLYTLHVHLGFGKKRLRKFYDAFSAEHDRLIWYYQMPDDYTWLCKEWSAAATAPAAVSALMLKHGTKKGKNPMKLKSIDDKVPYIMAAGKDFVKDEMSLAAAEQICSRGTQTASKLFPDFPICVDGKFYFAGTSTKPKSSKSKTPCEG